MQNLRWAYHWVSSTFWLLKVCYIANHGILESLQWTNQRFDCNETTANQEILHYNFTENFFEIVVITTVIHNGHEYHEFDSFILQFLGRRSSWRWTQYIGLSICIVALACIGMGKIKNLYIWVETSLPLTSSQNLFYKTILSKNPPKSNIWRNWKWFWVPTDMMLPLWKNH